jgi:hypothetical protein
MKLEKLSLPSPFSAKENAGNNGLYSLEKKGRTNNLSLPYVVC